MEENLDQEIQALEASMNDIGFWNDKEKAQETIKRIKELKDTRDGATVLDKGNAILTILAGAGGDDSEDFARMLFEMYDAYFSRTGFSYTILHSNKNDHSGFRNLTIEVSGKNAYGMLKNESGVHRLVRISPFNAQAKRHTSFAMVEVLPIIPLATRSPISPDEIRIETSKASGPGGQHQNKTASACRAVHRPTGLQIFITGRDQHANKREALHILTTKVQQLQNRQKQEAYDSQRKNQMGNSIGKRGDKVRTYNFIRGEIVDHRLGKTTSNIKEFMKGNFSVLFKED
jgi:peptide chain release factor 2